MANHKILVLFYSFSGKTADVAREVAAGAKMVSDCEVEIKRVPENIPNSFFDEHPQFKPTKEALEKEFPVATIDDLTSADAVAFGSPVHFGSFASQFKAFIDQLSPVYIKGTMANKPAAVFCSGGSIHGGEEATLLSMIIPLLNLGMLPVGIPYPIQGEGVDFDAGSPYGATFTSGHKGDLKMSAADKEVAKVLGRRLAMLAQVVNCQCETCVANRAIANKPID